jgi:hypothetical protein
MTAEGTDEQLRDTSVLISDTSPEAVEAAISVASIAELHFGVQITVDRDERAVRTQRPGAIWSTLATANAVAVPGCAVRA